jgi:putative ABC transport system substrate-binding protein
MIFRARLISIALACAVLALPGQSAGVEKSVRHVGHVFPRSEPWSGQFYEGLKDEGFVDGVNLAVLRSETGTDFARAGPLVDEMITQGSEVIVAQPGPIAREAQRAVQRAQKNIPIVFLSYDPIEEGFVTSLARPDRNMTGVASMVTTEIYAKQLELLLEVVPTASRIAYLRDPTSVPAAFARVKRDLEGAAEIKGVQLTFVEVPSAEHLEKVLAKLKHDKINALIVPPTAFFITHRRVVIDAVGRLRLPTAYGDELFVRDGGLLGYWPSMATTQRAIGRIVGMLLKGKRPADIPVEQPARFKLTINQKTATSLGLVLPTTVLLRADEVVK